MQIINDRRSRPRIPARGNAVVGIGTTKVRCPCVDLSSSGLGVVGPFAAAHGTSVNLEFSVGGRNVAIRAQIARARRRRDGFLWGLRIDADQAAQLEGLVLEHQRRIAWMRQVKPYLDRMPRSGASPTWAPQALSVELEEPRAAAPREDEPPSSRSEVRSPAAPTPAPASEEDISFLELPIDAEPEAAETVRVWIDEEPTKIYERAATQLVIDAQWEEILDATDHARSLDEDPTQPPRMPSPPEEGALAFEADILAKLEENDRRASSRLDLPTFHPPSAPPVRRPVPTLAAPNLTPDQLRKLYANAVSSVRGRKRRGWRS